MKGRPKGVEGIKSYRREMESLQRRKAKIERMVEEVSLAFVKDCIMLDKAMERTTERYLNKIIMTEQ